MEHLGAFSGSVWTVQATKMRNDSIFSAFFNSFGTVESLQNLSHWLFIVFMLNFVVMGVMYLVIVPNFNSRRK